MALWFVVGTRIRKLAALSHRQGWLVRKFVSSLHSGLLMACSDVSLVSLVWARGNGHLVGDESQVYQEVFHCPFIEFEEAWHSPQRVGVGVALFQEERN